MEKPLLHDYQKPSTLDQRERNKLLMQDRHDRDVTESVMLDPVFQTLRVMENMHYNSRTLPDPEIFAFDTGGQGAISGGGTASHTVVV